MTRKPDRTPKVYFSTGQIADLFDLAPSTVVKWLDLGRLPFLAISQKRRVHRDDLIAFSKEHGIRFALEALIDPARESSVVCLVGDEIRGKLVPQECLRWVSSWYALGYAVRDLKPRGVVLDGLMGLGEMRLACIALWKLTERPTVIVVLYDDQDPNYLEKCWDVKFHYPLIDPLLLAKTVDECRRR